MPAFALDPMIEKPFIVSSQGKRTNPSKATGLVNLSVVLSRKTTCRLTTVQTFELDPSLGSDHLVLDDSLSEMYSIKHSSVWVGWHRTIKNNKIAFHKWPDDIFLRFVGGPPFMPFYHKDADMLQ